MCTANDKIGVKPYRRTACCHKGAVNTAVFAAPTRAGVRRATILPCRFTADVEDTTA
jgi:ferredoxin-NADP reductase